MFVYGPPGNGKTVISQAIRNVLEGEIAIPHAIEVEGSIIRIFDPVIHEPVPQADRRLQLDGGSREDARWVKCRRPMVMVGGELRLESLELHRNAGFYRAPIQTVANGGVLVIDDFGRQQCTPRELLNRWIVPLESRVDFLTLTSVRRSSCHSTCWWCLRPTFSPVRSSTKHSCAGSSTRFSRKDRRPHEFITIFENCCHEQGVEFDSSVVDHLMTEWHRGRNIPLRGCHPRDLIKHALALADYLDRPRALSAELMDGACHGYFVHEESSVQDTV